MHPTAAIEPLNAPLLSRVWQGLCLIALLAMLALVGEHLPGQGLSFCSGAGCREAAGHPSAVVLALPAPLWAVALYVLLLFCSPARWHEEGRGWLALAGLLLLAASTAYYLPIMERDLVTPCRFCLAAHGCHLLLLLVALGALRRHPAAFPVAIPGAGIFLLPLLALLAGHLVLARPGSPPPVDKASLRQTVAPSFDRYHPALAHQRIAGGEDAVYQLTIIGSLACGHCRDLLAQIETLPEKTLARVSFSFIPFPLCERCNPRAGLASRDRTERCQLAAATIAAQRQGRFWLWYHQVAAAPGRMQRQLLPLAEQTPSWPTVDAVVLQLADVPVAVVPTLLWQGIPLPATAGATPLAQLLRTLMDIERESRSPAADPESCGC
ncbi:MAG: DsbA family protein [Thermodesulfobacteriota bacterium]